MSCYTAQELIHGYLDCELDVRETAEIERHIHECKACDSTYQKQLILRSALRDTTLYFKAPEDLKRRIHTSLQIEAKAETAHRPFRWSWALMAASLAVLLLATTLWKFAPAFRASSNDELVAHEVVADHIRSLQMTSHLIDVLSTNEHTVKPWFNGKIDFSPPVRDFAEHDFQLYGGRVGYLNNRTVATLVYQRRSHFINLYIWPVESSNNVKESSMQLQGYNLIQWTSSGMMYWAVSDLNSVELQEFTRYVQQ
ncbi:MAG TPA: zf-HC2 domain-containing protein [Pyrinomonadaceae bacterium]|nr:zf-HC2 domain-containing protein [Pyrinomonadaceae bacterium]